jgi:hypothetical protein
MVACQVKSGGQAFWEATFSGRVVLRRSPWVDQIETHFPSGIAVDISRITPIVGHDPFLVVIELNRLVPPAARTAIANPFVQLQGVSTDRAIRCVRMLIGLGHGMLPV